MAYRVTSEVMTSKSSGWRVIKTVMRCQPEQEEHLDSWVDNNPPTKVQMAMASMNSNVDH